VRATQQQEATTDIVRELLTAGADVKARTAAYHVTPLLLAVERGHFDVAQLLLQAGASPDAADIYGHTCLTIALERGRIDMLAAFVAAGAAVDTADVLQWTPLMVAVNTGNLAAVTALLDAGAAVDVGNEDNLTILMLVAAGTSQCMMRARY
jgi:ankyrin repeat protein